MTLLPGKSWRTVSTSNPLHLDNVLDLVPSEITLRGCATLLRVTLGFGWFVAGLKTGWSIVGQREEYDEAVDESDEVSLVTMS